LAFAAVGVDGLEVKKALFSGRDEGGSTPEGPVKPGDVGRGRGKGVERTPSELSLATRRVRTPSIVTSIELMPRTGRRKSKRVEGCFISPPGWADRRRSSSASSSSKGQFA
jgi:hypothetical protein